MCEQQPTKRIRVSNSWFQFSLRTLLTLLTIFAVLAAWWSHKARQQFAAREMITNVRGNSSFDFEDDSHDRPPYWPPWLVDSLGADYFANVTVVRLQSTQITDAEVQTLGRLTSLRKLFLARTRISDQGLSHLRRLTRLEQLDLMGTKVTDAGLDHLNGLTLLQRLRFNETEITDVGLKQLSGLRALTYLGLNETKVTDSGIEHLACLTSLKLVDLRGTEVTTGGVARLKNALPRCEIAYGPAISKNRGRHSSSVHDETE